MARSRRAQDQNPNGGTSKQTHPTPEEWWLLVRKIIAKHSLDIADGRTTVDKTWFIQYVLGDPNIAKGKPMKEWLAPPINDNYRAIRWRTLQGLMGLSRFAVRTHIECSRTRNRPFGLQDVRTVSNEGFYCSGMATGPAAAAIGHPLDRE